MVEVLAGGMGRKRVLEQSAATSMPPVAAAGEDFILVLRFKKRLRLIRRDVPANPRLSDWILQKGQISLTKNACTDIRLDTKYIRSIPDDSFCCHFGSAKFYWPRIAGASLLISDHCSEFWTLLQIES